MLDALNDDQADGLGRFLTERFRAYASARQEWESIWRDCWERYILEFREEIDETEGKGGRSNDRYGLARRKVKIFVAFMYDQLFGQGKLPFDLKNTPVPDYAVQHANGMLEKGAFDFLENDAERVEGMADLIDDQLTEGKWRNEVQSGLLQMGIFGGCAIEGPIVEERVRVEYQPIPVPAENLTPDNQGGFDPRSMTPQMEFEQQVTKAPFPRYRFRDIWDVYPDLTSEDIQEGEGVFVVDELTEYDLATMAKSSGYDEEAVLEILNGAKAGNEMEIDRGPHRDQQPNEQHERQRDDKRFYVITYHGKLAKKDLESYTDSDDMGDRSLEDFVPQEVRVTFCQSKVLSYEVNDHPKEKRQIKMAPTWKMPGSPFGWSIVWEMRDSEKVMNAFLRLFIDNKRDVAYVDKVIDRSRVMNPDEKSSFGKEWLVEPGASIDGAVQYLPKLDVSSNSLEMLNFCEQWGNAASGLPAFLEGDDIQTSSNTAYEVGVQKDSALKMLGQTMQSLDENIVIPCVEDLYFWNMVNADDNTIKGDYEIQATGAQSFRDNVVLANYVRQLLEIASSNEAMAAEIDYREAITVYAKTAGVGLEKMIKTVQQKADEQAQMQQAQQAQMQAQQQAIQQQSQLEIEAKLAEIQAKHQADMEQLMAKLNAQEEAALLNSEGKKREQDIKILERLSGGPHAKRG